MKDKEIISMCGSGITACHNILALEIIGIRDVKLYVDHGVVDHGRQQANSYNQI